MIDVIIPAYNAHDTIHKCLASIMEQTITDILKVDEYDTVLCCGPEVMMKKVVEMCKMHGVQVFVSMEKHMACGVGACLVCTCKTKDGNKRTCKDGPVFDGNYVEL